MNLADLLIRKGHKIAFFAMKDKRNIFDSNADLFVSNINFRNLNKRKSLISGLRVLSRVIYSVESRNKFNKLVNRFHPDIIHLQNIHAHISPSIIFEAIKHGIPVVWTLHDYKLICPNSHFIIDKKGEICEACGRNSYLQAIFKRCKKDSILASTMAVIEAYSHRIMGLRNKIDFFISPSIFLRKKLINRGFKRNKVKHLPLFLPDKMFNKESKSNGYLLFLGKLEPIKGIFHLLEACKQSPNINLILAGKVREPIASRLSRLLPPNARYVGIKKGDELRKILIESTALVLPSIWYENQPFSILEAFAAGKPVIASDLGGMTELIKNSRGGLLIPPGNPDSLREAMHWIMEHPEHAKKLGKSAREYVLREHNSQIHYEKLMQIYKGVI
jgi:glycosyltransferase involved in cell wall biosynthesis